MKVYVNEITGIADAITAMFMSKRTWTRELECKIRNICRECLESNGALNKNANIENIRELEMWIDSLVKWGWKHITLLRYIDISVTVEGLHRGGQDDWDAHAKRFDNRILRSSTRLSDFGYEMSDFYKDKILPTDLALQKTDIELPDEIYIDGERYIKAVNGYIKEGYENNKDVKRGLYMLSIPSNFIFKVNLAEWAHVYKERNMNGSANPEVKQCCEAIANQLEKMHSQFNRELFEKIKN